MESPLVKVIKQSSAFKTVPLKICQQENLSSRVQEDIRIAWLDAGPDTECNALIYAPRQDFEPAPGPSTEHDLSVGGANGIVTVLASLSMHETIFPGKVQATKKHSDMEKDQGTEVLPNLTTRG